MSPDSKPAKKKRRSRTGKKSGEEPGTRFTIEEDVGMSTSVEPTVSASSNYPVDPIAELKKQISEAKASKVSMYCVKIVHFSSALWWFFTCHNDVPTL